MITSTEARKWPKENTSAYSQYFKDLSFEDILMMRCPSCHAQIRSSISMSPYAIWLYCNDCGLKTEGYQSYTDAANEIVAAIKGEAYIPKTVFIGNGAKLKTFDIDI